MATKKYVSLSNLTSFFNNLKNLFATKTELNTKSDKTHIHTISNITDLQSALNNKANSSHGAHVSYSSTAPLMDGAASAGSASTVSRSDHVHPTDTSRAAQTILDSHTSNTTIHITSSERTNWNAGYTHSQSSHAPSNAEKNQNAFSNVVVGSTTIAADTSTDTLTLVAGDNITITPDATNDKIAISAKDTTYSLSSFGITATAAELNKLDGVTATATEINYIDGVTSNIQTQLDNKAAKSHTHTVANITDLTATVTELNYMDGVTSSVQAQLDGKASSGHTHSYAGSSSAGGAATSANKLNTNAGSDTQPVYFSNGIPVKTTYTLGKSVPSNAVFTDTHYTSKNIVGSNSAVSNTTTALTNGNVYLNSVENGMVTSSHKISGSGATTVTTDNSGNIVVNSTNTTYVAAGSSLGLVKSGGDVTISSGVITVNDDSHNHTISNVDNLQTSLDAKQATITGGASTIAGSNLTANRALISNGSGKVAVSDITSTELGYLDGAKSNIQTQLDGKAASSHNHSYAGSSSVGGSATSAVKLQTARSIGLGGDLTGSASFDGSENITISAKHYNVSVNSGNKSNYPYHRFAYIGSKASPITSQYNDTDAIFLIRKSYNGGGYGILKVSLRTNASTSTSQVSATWLVRYNIALDDVKIGLYNVAGTTYADLYIKVGTYARTIVSQLEGNRSWTLVVSNEVNDTTTTDAKTSTESYVSIETAATKLHSQSYTSITSSVDGGHVNYANSAGSATSATTSSTCTGNSATATKLSSSKTISLTGDVTGSTSFDGSGNVSITTTVEDDSHNHVISNVDGLQSALDGKSATSHTHTADNLVQWANALFGTNNQGGVEYSYGSGSGKNVLTEISNMPQGLHTAYAISGTTGNPKTNESFRYLIHKTSGTIGWILAWDAQGSLFTNYQSAAGTFKGWKCVYDANPSALWTGGYYMSSSDGNPQTVKPSKKLSECRNGWVLVWSDYDPDTSTKNNTDIHHDYVFKKNCSGANWSGQCMLCDIPRYMGSNAQDVDTERRILKAIYIHDDRIEGSYQGSYDERNDVILRAVYEF